MLDLLLVIFLVVVGVGLLLLEMFLLPGFGIAGISGFVALTGAVVSAYVQMGVMAGRITLAACLVLAALSVYGFLRSRALEKMSLDTTIDSKVDLANPGKKIEKLEADAQRMEQEQSMPTNINQ